MLLVSATEPVLAILPTNSNGTCVAYTFATTSDSHSDDEPRPLALNGIEPHGFLFPFFPKLV